ncbi:MAG: nucleoside recognition domain-containing protein [Limnochordia bacterium]|jgi:spore maturation protein A
MNHVWLIMIVTGVISILSQQGRDVGDITSVIVVSSTDAVKLAISLTGVLAFWSGIMQLAQEAGLTSMLARLLAPIVRQLFPDVPKDHPAMGAILISIGANLLGLGNAATPLGIRAMEELQTINRTPHQASNAMCTFVAVCASGLTLIPTTVIALRGATGSEAPTSIVAATCFATACATTAALIADRLFRRPPWHQSTVPTKAGQRRV